MEKKFIYHNVILQNFYFSETKKGDPFIKLKFKTFSKEINCFIFSNRFKFYDNLNLKEGENYNISGKIINNNFFEGCILTWISKNKNENISIDNFKGIIKNDIRKN